MPLTSPTMDEAVAHSPRLYASAFKSVHDRFKDIGPEKESLQLSYDIKTFDTGAAIASSPRRLAAVFRKPTETSGPPVSDVPHVYDVDALNKSSVERRMHDSGKFYAFNYTDQRFKYDLNKLPEGATERYNTDVLHKAGMATGIITTPRRYANFDKGKPRPDPANPVHGDYHPKNHEMQTLLEKSPRRYAIMKSEVNRVDPHKYVKMMDAVYNTEKLDRAGVAARANMLPGSKSAFVSTPRKGMALQTSAPDKLYDIDAGAKSSLWKSIQTSGNPAPLMAHSSRTDGMKPAFQTHLDYFVEDNPVKPTLAFGVLTSPRYYSNMRSSTNRFDDAETQATQLQAWYDPESCAKGEGNISKRIMESPRKYFGGQSMADRSMGTYSGPALQLHYDPEYGKYMGMKKKIDTSPMVYSAMRSQLPRFKTEKKAAVMDEYEQLLRNPDKIDLKFQIRGNIVVKKTSDRALLVVGRQAPPTS